MPTNNIDVKYQSIHCPSCSHTWEVEEEIGETLYKDGDTIQCSWCGLIFDVNISNTRTYTSEKIKGYKKTKQC